MRDISLSPSDWGPFLWSSLHYIALGYPLKPSTIDKLNYSEFFINLHKVIPCITCADHYKEMIEKYPPSPHTGSLEELFQWTVDIHNKVNTRLEKKTLSVEEAFNIYKQPLSSPNSVVMSSPAHVSVIKNSTHSSTMWWIVILLLAIMVCVTVYDVTRRRKT
jgi:hypothetical protein